MTMDTFGRIIGRGERSALEILKMIWPNGMYEPQASLSRIADCYHYPEPLSERQRKETIDIFCLPSFKHGNIAVRVQDKRHRGQGLARADKHQADILTWCKVKIVDLHENECPELFKERVNYLSVLEVCQALKLAKVKP